MTTEFILLFGMFAFILIGIYLGDSGPRNVFFNSAPRLGARVEAHLTTGRGFVAPGTGAKVRWQRPSGAAPSGKL